MKIREQNSVGLGLAIGFMVLFVVNIVCGCGRNNKPEGFPDRLYPCEIILTQEGLPLSGAYVELFHQEADKKNWASAGIANAEGYVKIYTYGKWQGAPEGSFNVTVTLREIEKIKNKEITYTLVDENYAKPETTPLKLEIKGKTKQNFDVGKKTKKIIKDE
ncbi:MAG: hypothetical protein LBP59_17300 [Planctomycetaceae bacterium]|jgi:hypothetical protein|nr:hypothetical protein [Planctomycetaceae bacterium]